MIIQIFQTSHDCLSRLVVLVLELTLEFEWQCRQYLELNPTCVKPQVGILYLQEVRTFYTAEPHPGLLLYSTTSL